MRCSLLSNLGKAHTMQGRPLQALEVSQQACSLKTERYGAK